MKRAEVPFRVHLSLFAPLFLGLSLCVLIPMDAEWFHYVLKPPEKPVPGTSIVATPANPATGQKVEDLKKSILNIRVPQCNGQGENLGTGFVVKSGFVATAAHILGDQQSCGSHVSVIDYRGLSHPAEIDGLSTETDLALLRISDVNLPPLDLADSTAYESTNGIVQVVTIGYPLEGVGSSSDHAALSGQGNLSRFDPTNGLFITSGMNLNHGNSGGPIFLLDSWKVLGVATAKLKTDFGEGIGIITPSKTLVRFFREKTGQEIR
jgi:S1-C subfamily serine protease